MTSRLSKSLFPFAKTKQIYKTHLLFNQFHKISDEDIPTLSRDVLGSKKVSFEIAMRLALLSLGGKKNIMPNIGTKLNHKLEQSIEKLKSSGHTFELNQPESQMCQANEVLMIEYLYLNKAAIRNQDNCLKLHLMPISNDRIRRNIAYSLGLDFYKLRKLTKIHVVFYSNIKMRVLDDKNKVVYGDASENHLFNSDSYQRYVATFEHESSIFASSSDMSE